MVKRLLALAGALALFALPVAACGDDDDDGGGGGGGGGRSEEEIVIGWTPPDITGVFKTATDFFERAADDANKNGFDVKVISRSPATHTAVADQLAGPNGGLKVVFDVGGVEQTRPVVGGRRHVVAVMFEERPAIRRKDEPRVIVRRIRLAGRVKDGESQFGRRRSQPLHIFRSEWRLLEEERRDLVLLYDGQMIRRRAAARFARRLRK